MNFRQGCLAGLMAAMALLLAAETASAQLGTQAGDPRIKRQLDEIGWNYEVDSDGDFRMLFSFDHGRSQFVFIISQTEKLDHMEIREVWSPGFRTGDPIDARLAHELLRENHTKKLGAWRLIPAGDGEYMAIFAAHIDADTDIETLKSVVRVVSITADEREKEVTGEDEF